MQQNESQLFKSYACPLILFLLLTLLMLVIDAGWGWDHPNAAWWQRAPEMVVYPLQTLVCGAFLWWTRRGITWDWSWKSSAIGAAAGLLGIGFWLIPYLAGWVDASDGFDPARIFGEGTLAYYAQYTLRFVRAVIIVAMAEEFFWRGYLMRWCVDADEPEKVSFGTPSWKGFALTTFAFMLIHLPQDYAGAFVFGSIAYGLTVLTRRLSSVVLMHAVANLVMGVVAIACDLPGLW
ncbi:MAG: CPBP family glutamic-type intramembrane protease [Akkermansia sp.]